VVVLLDVFGFATSSGTVSEDSQHYQDKQRDKNHHDCNLNYHQEKTNQRDELSQ
jgi:hypothetical protein